MPEPLGPSQSQWVAALRDKDPRVAQLLDQPREEGVKLLESYELPGYRHVYTIVDDFLNDPNHFADQVGGADYFVRFISDPKGGAVLARQRNLSREELIEFVKQNRHVIEGYPNYQLVIGENYPNVYGGNIVVNPDQSIVVEFRRGSQGPISTGIVTPEFRVERHGESQSFCYSFDDQELRKVIYSTLRSLPHDGRVYLPAYYEFHLIRRTENDPLEPIFVDMSTRSAYFTRGT